MTKFPEAFLHYVWKLQLFDSNNLQTTDGDPIQVLEIGEHNHHAGPDFLNARIRIGSTLWAGSVEIHIKASDWNTHRHSEDAAYQNTILHVVYEHDATIHLPSGDIVKTLELKNRIPPAYIQRYWKLLKNNYWIPCQPQLATEQALQLPLMMMMHRLVAERMEQKTLAIYSELQQTLNHWEETFYRSLAKYFGVRQNTAPFEALAKSLPLKILGKHKNNLQQLEALLFGQAGMLEGEMQDTYCQQLQKEYRYLKQKYQLTPLNAASWKFSKMRPAAFPTIRIAQLAQLIYQSVHLFSKILAAEQVADFRAFFELKLDGYWKTHYRLGEESPARNKTLGKATIDLLLINAVAPTLFIYGQYNGQSDLQEKALDLLQNLAAEKNNIITSWQDFGIQATSAFDTQGLLHLKTAYCDQKRCLDCAVGNKIIKTNTN